WVVVAVGVAFISRWFAAVGALLAAAGAAVALGGWPLAKAALPAWVFLWMTIPPPRKYDFVLVARLQDVVSRLAGMLLGTVGVVHVMDGNVVQVAGRDLLVDQACSGIYSLFTLLIGALFYALWVRVSVVRGLCLAVASVCWVLVGNMVRIVLVVVLSTRYGIDAATGWQHEAIGLVMFLVMLGLVMSTDRMVMFVLSVLAQLGWMGRMLLRASNPPEGPNLPAGLAAPGARSKDEAWLGGVFATMPTRSRPAP